MKRTRKPIVDTEDDLFLNNKKCSEKRKEK